MENMTQGKCYLCGGLYAKSGMTLHLKSCGGAIAAAPGNKEERGAGLGLQECLHLQVEGRYMPQYWLHLEVPLDATLGQLDSFLRGTWLECCDHMSAFEIRRKRYDFSFYGPRKKGKDIPLAKAVRAGETFTHEYDFGSTTVLKLRLLGKRIKGLQGEGIAALARNEAPEYKCNHCDGIAEEICTLCLYEDQGMLCARCAEGHGCGEDELMPVVNSPRVGVCGYCG